MREPRKTTHKRKQQTQRDILTITSSDYAWQIHQSFAFHMLIRSITTHKIAKLKKKKERKKTKRNDHWFHETIVKTNIIVVLQHCKWVSTLIYTRKRWQLIVEGSVFVVHFWSRFMCRICISRSFYFNFFNFSVLILWLSGGDFKTNFIRCHWDLLTFASRETTLTRKTRKQTTKNLFTGRSNGLW